MDPLSLSDPRPDLAQTPLIWRPLPLDVTSSQTSTPKQERQIPGDQGFRSFNLRAIIVCGLQEGTVMGLDLDGEHGSS